MSYDTKFHRDGTITIWSTHHQRWGRVKAEAAFRDDLLMSTLSDDERRRIEAMAHGMTATEARRLASRLCAAADDGGTIQADGMLRVTGRWADPTLHTTMCLGSAARRLGCYYSLPQ